MNPLKRSGFLLIAALVLLAPGCASTSSQESTGEYLDDSVITSKVKGAIFNDPSLKVLEISVQTYKHSVQLSGLVSSKDQMDKAGELARAVDGVRSVRNDLRLK